MKKLILTTLAVSISIISACTPTIMPTPAVGVGNNITNSNKLTKDKLVKYFNCLLSKSDDIQKTSGGAYALERINVFASMWKGSVDSLTPTQLVNLNAITEDQIANLNRDYAKFGCVL